MSKLDSVDAELTAPDLTLKKVAASVTTADIEGVLSSDIPFEPKRSQLSGLIAVLGGEGRDAVQAYAKAALERVEQHDRSTDIPQITS